jgi:hypothetical protein
MNGGMSEPFGWVSRMGRLGRAGWWSPRAMRPGGPVGCGSAPFICLDMACPIASSVGAVVSSSEGSPRDPGKRPSRPSVPSTVPSTVPSAVTPASHGTEGWGDKAQKGRPNEGRQSEKRNIEEVIEMATRQTGGPGQGPP